MMWKKFLLEICALSGFGGGIGGWIGSSNNGFEVSFDDEIHYFGESASNLNQKQKFNDSFESDFGLVSLLNNTVLRSWRFKSEGVGEDLLFIKGWDYAGPHKVIDSDSHSQNPRELFGGRKISNSMGWFGPRVASRITQEIYGEKKEISKKNFWDILRDSGKYISKEELKGISDYWGRRDIELEEEVLSLYQPRSWWIQVMGEDKQKNRVALDLDLTGMKDMLNQTEEELKTKRWTYGQWFNSSWIKTIRLLGNLEEVAFNYLKKMIWPEEATRQKLKEKNIATVIKRLMSGEKVGFDCDQKESSNLSKYFEECKSTSSRAKDITVKAVLKSVWSGSGNYVPGRNKGPGWKTQHKANYQEWKELKDMDDIEKTKVLEEECEQSSWWMWGDTEIKIRQELCKRIINPWFGDNVEDKRLCLIEAKGFSYLLQFQTYFKVFEFPTWHNKNTFWTKCSNYGI